MKADRIIAWGSVIGLLALAGIGIWEHAYATGYKAGATEQPAPIVVYRRGEYSTEELHRILRQRARMARTK